MLLEANSSIAEGHLHCVIELKYIIEELRCEG